MRLLAIDHIVLTTSDIRECVSFYEDILVMKHECSHGRHVLKFGNQKINIHERAGEFLPAASRPAAGSLDFCLVAEGNISQIAEEARLHGGRIVEGPVERIGARGVMDSIYLYDPDGNLVEIAVYR